MKTIKVETEPGHTVEVEVRPCIVCGSDDIQLYNCKDFMHNVASATCKDCGREERWYHSGSDGAIANLTGLWNHQNDVEQLIASTQAAIAEEREKLKSLKKYGRLRP